MISQKQNFLFICCIFMFTHFFNDTDYRLPIKVLHILIKLITAFIPCPKNGTRACAASPRRRHLEPKLKRPHYEKKIIYLCNKIYQNCAEQIYT